MKGRIEVVDGIHLSQCYVDRIKHNGLIRNTAMITIPGLE